MDTLGWLGANMSQSSANNRMMLFSNAVSQMRGFSQDGAYAVLTTPLDVNGWPTAACTMILSGGNLDTGTYLMKWKEGASPAFSSLSGTGWAITGRTSIGGGYYTGTLTVTDRTVGIAVSIGATGVSELQVMMPGLPLNYASHWHPDTLDYWKQFNIIRTLKNNGVERIPLPEGDYSITFTGGGTIACSAGAVYGTVTNGGASPCVITVLRGMDFLITTTGTVGPLTITGPGGRDCRAVGTNSATVRAILPKMWTWADRIQETHREAAYSRTRDNFALGIEELVSFANEVYARPGSKLKGMLFNLYHHADDTHLNNWLQYIFDNLNPAICAYLELSNELWNRQFYHAANDFWQRGQDEVAAGPSDLNFDGSFGLSGNYWMYRMGARRAVEMSVAAQTIFGASFGTRCKPVLATQLASANVAIAKTQYLEDIRSVNLKNTFPGGLAVSVYTFLGAGGAGGTPFHGLTPTQMVAHFDTDATEGLPARLATVQAFREVAGRHQMDLIAYEGGPDFSGATSYITGVTQTDLQNIGIAMDSTDMHDHVIHMIAQWMLYGGGAFMYFNAGVRQNAYEWATANSGQLNMTSWFDAQDSATIAGGVGIAPGFTPLARLQALYDARDLVVPDGAALVLDRRCPGTISPYNFAYNDRSIYPANSVWNYSTVPSPARATLASASPMTGRWSEFGFYVNVAGTYSMQNSIRCNDVATFTYSIDGTTVQTFSNVNTGGDPFGTAAIPQTPVSVTLAKGWHKMRVKIDCLGGSTMRVGFGDTVFT